MNAEFFDALDALEKTRGIPKQYMYERVEAALTSAVKKETDCANVHVVIDESKKEVRVYRCLDIVEEVENPKTQISLEEAKKISRKYELGGVYEVEMKTKTFGRLSAQAAKQVIVQGIREAEKNNILREYEKKREEIVTALVTKVNDNTGDVIVDTGTSETVLLKSEQIPGESFAVGDRVKVFITEVRRPDQTTGPLVTLSRTQPNMIKRMFELVVPEIQDGTIIIHGVAREAGSRTKLSVYSRNPEVDPIGACVGTGSSRIASIIRELHGEKLDIVTYSEDPSEYIASALSPAKVKSVEFDGERSAKVYVDNDHLSLAIGREGQNVRLAARLTGFKIDIKGV